MPEEMSNTAARPPLASLRRFLRSRRPCQRCELCSAELLGEHEHVLDLGRHELLCACYACAVLSQGSGRYRRVPGRVWRLADLELSEPVWASLRVPSQLAFFVLESTPPGSVRALRPSRAGASESRPPGEIWQRIVADNPVLRRMQPEVEALLVNRLGARRNYYLVPIDACYRLVALVRTHWHGLSGGRELWGAVERYFGELRRRSVPAERNAHA